MPMARDRGTLRATPAASRHRTLIGTCIAFAASSALPSSWTMCASPHDATSQCSQSAGLSASMASSSSEQHHHRGREGSVSSGQRHPHRATRCGACITLAPGQALFRLNMLKNGFGALTVALSDGAGDAVVALRIGCAVAEGLAVFA